MDRPDTSSLDRARYVSLTTFRRDGTPVSSPVWVVRHDDGWACTTGRDSWKVRRLRHNDHVEVAASDVRGRVSGDTPVFTGTARVVDDPAEYRRIRSAVVRKYWLLGPVLVAWSTLTRLVGRGGDEAGVAWTVEAAR